MSLIGLQILNYQPEYNVLPLFIIKIVYILITYRGAVNFKHKYRTYWNSTRGYYFFFKVYVRLINGRGFNMEEVIIFTEKKHTQKIAFLYGIFSEKNSYIIINLYSTIYKS